MQYRIYVTGAVNFSGSRQPIQDAARELLARHASPTDTLGGTLPEGELAPVSLAAIVRPRTLPFFDHRQPRGGL